MAAAAAGSGPADGQQPSATPSAAATREAYSAAAAAEQQQQMNYIMQQQLAAQGISHAYPGMMESGGPVDPTQAQVAAFANQAAMYGPYGSPYALNMPPPPTGGPYHPGMNGQFGFPQVESFQLPGPAYYDPFGMINPAACVAPIQGPQDKEVEQPKHIRRKASKKWFGCC